MGGNSSSKYQVPDPPVSTVSDEGVRGNSKCKGTPARTYSNSSVPGAVMDMKFGILPV